MAHQWRISDRQICGRYRPGRFRLGFAI